MGELMSQGSDAARSLLVIGGARSGKSRYAQSRAEQTGLKPIYIATAQAFDDEMRDRIAQHRADRGEEWHTIEAPVALADTIRDNAAANRVILVDCLTLWVTNLMMQERDIAAATEQLVGAVRSAPGALILVGNEVGWGIVPDNPLARSFRDHAGIVNQRIAQAVDEVQLVAAGLNIAMKAAQSRNG